MLIPQKVPNWPVWIREFTDEKKESNLIASLPGNTGNPNEVEMETFRGEDSPIPPERPYKKPSIFTKVRNFFDMDQRFPRFKVVKMSN